MEACRQFLSSTVGSSLKVWVQRLDGDHDHKVSAHEFGRTLKNMGFNGDIPAVIAALDCDRNGELSLEELDASQAELWQRFRMWCCNLFKGSEDMMQKFSGLKRKPVEKDRLSRDQFCENLDEYGWMGGHEHLLFRCLECDDEQGIAQSSLAWLDLEKRRQAKKEKARQRARQDVNHRNRDIKAAKQILKKFKATLKRNHGSYVRAWRAVLSPNDNMILQKTQFFTACADMGWAKHVRLLWKAFGKVGHGQLSGEKSISIEDLDPKSAETLAHFCVWVRDDFGGTATAFREFDRYDKKKIHQQEFLDAVSDLGFSKPAKVLFHGLDKDGKKALVEDDIRFLDSWKPPAYLLASANQAAVDHVKALLLNRFRNYLKAWRRVLDKDSSNRCCWREFQAACSAIGFSGDVPGAWRSLDYDLSGFITLGEIDATSAKILEGFRAWSAQEFGSVRSAFTVFDTNGSNCLSQIEFKRCCRIYGYEGNAGSLFRALDVERDGQLFLEEVAFLDEWELDQELVEEVSSKNNANAPEKNPKTLMFGEGGKNQQASQNNSKEVKHRAKGMENPRHRKFTRMPTPERVWWSDIPCRREWTSIETPRTGKGKSIWCAMCKTRGICSHVVECTRESVTPKPPATVRSPSVISGSLDRSRTWSSDRSRTWSSQSRASRTSPSSAAPTWAWEVQSHPQSARGSTPLFLEEFSTRLPSSSCCSPDAEVQHMALRNFPIGSVTPGQAAMAFHMLVNTSDGVPAGWSGFTQSATVDSH